MAFWRTFWYVVLLWSNTICLQFLHWVGVLLVHEFHLSYVTVRSEACLCVFLLPAVTSHMLCCTVKYCHALSAHCRFLFYFVRRGCTRFYLTFHDFLSIFKISKKSWNFIRSAKYPCATLSCTALPVVGIEHCAWFGITNHCFILFLTFSCLILSMIDLSSWWHLELPWVSDNMLRCFLCCKIVCSSLVWVAVQPCPCWVSLFVWSTHGHQDTLLRTEFMTLLASECHICDQIISDLFHLFSVPRRFSGLAWTPTGGELLYVEASRMAGTGKLTVTGNLGEEEAFECRDQKGRIKWFSVSCNEA